MEDKRIVQEILNGGSTRLFAPVVQRYSGMMLSKALTITHNRDRAAEAVQMAFAKAYASLDAWRGDSLGPWLVTITLHTALHLIILISLLMAPNWRMWLTRLTLKSGNGCCRTWNGPSPPYPPATDNSSHCIIIRKRKPTR